MGSLAASPCWNPTSFGEPEQETSSILDVFKFEGAAIFKMYLFVNGDGRAFIFEEC
jgi:hypothetical protein